MSTKFLIGGLLAGAAVGVAIGMLFSPQGERTREKLMSGARKLGDALNRSSVGESLKEEFNQEVDRVADKGKQFIESTSQKVKA
jgi:gas vesicle protein